MAKIFEHAGQRIFDQLYFLILFGTASALTAVLLLAEYKKTGKKPVWKELLAGMAVGIPNYFSSVLLLVTIIGAAVFQERPGKKGWTGYRG